MSDQQFRPAHSAFDESPEVKEAAALSLAGKRPGPDPQGAGIHDP